MGGGSGHLNQQPSQVKRALKVLYKKGDRVGRSKAWFDPQPSQDREKDQARKRSAPVWF